MRKQALAYLLLAGVMLLASPARAGLFDDDEARKAILELRASIADMKAAHEQAQASLRQQLKTQQDQIALMQRNELERNSQIDQLNSSIAKLRGQLEQANNDISKQQTVIGQLQNQSNQLQSQTQAAQTQLAGMQTQVARMAPVEVNIDGQATLVEQTEKRQFEAAVASFRDRKYDLSVSLFSSFLTTYPSSPFLYQAQYWLGNAYFALDNCKSANPLFAELVRKKPQDPSNADIRMNWSECLLQLKNRKQAKAVLNEIVSLYPGSEAAKVAKQKAAAIK